VLTGRETVAATFAATAHLHRDRPAAIEVAVDGTRRTTTWADVVRTVRHAAVALAGEGLGDGASVALEPGAPAPHRAVVLLVAAATGAVVVGGRGQVLDLASLAVAGSAIDDRHPDRFEVLVAARDRHEVLLHAAGVDHTHASLLVAARSFAQGAGIGPEDGLHVGLRPGTAAEAVLAVVVPALTGAAAWTSAASTAAPGPDPLAATGGPTWVVSGAPGAPAPRARRRWRRPLPPAPRHLLVVGDAAGPHTGERLDGVDTAGSVDAALAADTALSVDVGLAADTALSVDAAGGVVTGFGPPGSVGRPLPGVSVTVEDGEVLVRSCGVPPGAPGLGADGWLATGRRGRLEGGALVLEPSAAAVPAARPA
jgi:hypothetical protein